MVSFKSTWSHKYLQLNYQIKAKVEIEQNIHGTLPSESLESVSCVFFKEINTPIKQKCIK